MQIVECIEKVHAPFILEILNDEILNSTSLYDYKPRTMLSMKSWYQSKRRGNFPVLGAVDANQKLLGFASYGTFRAWPAYKYTVEHSIYVHRDHRGQGIGKHLMQTLIARAIEQEFHMMVGGISSENTGSIAMHKKLGFVHAGTLCQAAFKFGRWLDLEFHQRILETPSHPIDG